VISRFPGEASSATFREGELHRKWSPKGKRVSWGITIGKKRRTKPTAKRAPWKWRRRLLGSKKGMKARRKEKKLVSDKLRHKPIRDAGKSAYHREDSDEIYIGSNGTLRNSHRRFFAGQGRHPKGGCILFLHQRERQVHCAVTAAGKVAWDAWNPRRGCW